MPDTLTPHLPSPAARFTSAMACLVLAASCVAATRVCADQYPSEGARTLLLVDDHHILYQAGTHRVLRPLDRHARNPMVRPDKAWEAGTIAYCSVHRLPETGKYQMWYQAWPVSQAMRLCYATSEDGLTWTKPNLQIDDFDAIQDTNIVMRIGFGAGVIVDPRSADPARRYKFAYWGTGNIDGHRHPGTCVAFSPDGIHWSDHPVRPLIKGSHGGYIQPPLSGDTRILTGALGGPPLSTSDVTDPMWDPIRETFALYTKTWLDGPDGTMHWKRAVVRTDSKDFVHWSKPRLVMAPDDRDQGSDGGVAGGGGSNGTQLHSGPTFYHNGVYFSLLQVMDSGATGNMPIELAVSRDGLHWSRPFRGRFFLPPLADKTKFDASIIWSNATPVLLDDEFRIYYGAYGKAWNSPDPQQISGIGLATMPRDRFAAIQPIAEQGQITLKSLDLSKYRSIQLNGNGAGGQIRVEILDANGYRMPGFTRDDAVAVTSDSLRHPVQWMEKQLTDLAEGEYRLRVHLSNAKVYALTFVP